MILEFEIAFNGQNAHDFGQATCSAVSAKGWHILLTYDGLPAQEDLYKITEYQSESLQDSASADVSDPIQPKALLRGGANSKDSASAGTFETQDKDNDNKIASAHINMLAESFVGTLNHLDVLHL